MDKRSQKAFWAAFWSGIAAPGMLYAADDIKITRIDVPKTSRHSDRDSMRGDWIKIGQDFNAVIAREKAATK